MTLSRTTLTVPPAPHPAQPLRSAIEQKTVLVVDDDPAIRDLTEMHLAFGGYDPVSCSRGHDALAHIRRINPAVVLLDVELGDLSGMQICSWIKADVSLRHIPVILISGSRIWERDIIDGLKTGADDYLLKPMTRDLLLAKIETVLKRRQMAAGPAVGSIPQFYPLTLRRETTLTQHRQRVDDRAGRSFRTDARRWPDLLLTIGALLILGGWSLTEFYPAVPAFMSAVLWGLGLAAFGALAGFFGKRELVYSEYHGEPRFGIRQTRRGFFSVEYELSYPDGTQSLGLAREGLQLFGRQWSLLDQAGNSGPEIRERSFFKAVLRKFLGHLWGNFKAEFDVWYDGRLIGRIDRLGFLKRDMRVSLDEDPGGLDPMLMLTVASFIDFRDPDRWFPWIN